MGPQELTRAVSPLRARPHETVLLFDFDGTLAPVVADPAAAAAPDAVRTLLARLAPAYRRVGVVSGRPLAFLVDRLPDGLALSGLYGLEASVDGAAVAPPGVAPADLVRWRAGVSEAAEIAATAAAHGAPLDGLVVEPKGLSLTLHWRTAPHLADAAVALADDLAGRCGLHARPAKASVELHPPASVDKGTAVRALAAGAAAVLYVGDDVGDIPALDALAGLRADGIETLAVVVGGDELPEPLRSRADLVLADQPEVRALLEALVPESLLPEG